MPLQIMVAMIVYDGISPETMKSLAPLLVQPGIRWGDWTRDGLVSRGRSFLASRFLEGDAQILLEIDADIGFNWKDALEICEQAMDHDIVGGVYVGRRMRSGNIPTTMFLPDTPVRFGRPDEPDARKPVEVMFPAGGFRATHRRVFEKLQHRADQPVCHAYVKGGSFRPFYQPFPWTDKDGNVLYLSEDWAMVQRAREEGFKAYVNPGVRLTHVARQYFRLEDAVPSLAAASAGFAGMPLTFTQKDDLRLSVIVGDPEPEAETPAEGESSVTEPEAVELPPGLSA